MDSPKNFNGVRKSVRVTAWSIEIPPSSFVPYFSNVFFKTTGCEMSKDSGAETKKSRRSKKSDAAEKTTKAAVVEGLTLVEQDIGNRVQCDPSDDAQNAQKERDEARAEAISQLPERDRILYAEEEAVAKESAARENRERLEDDQPDVPANEKVHRYDLIITSEKPGYKPPKAAISAMIQQLVFRGFASGTEEAIADGWQEVYFVPGPSAHELFMEKGSYNSDNPVYHELIFRVSDKPFTCAYTTTPNRPLYWSIEICGSRFKTVTGAFKKFFLDAYQLRIAVDAQDAGPAREHRVVPKEEVPEERKKRERGNGLAGVEVNEF